MRIIDINGYRYTLYTIIYMEMLERSVSKQMGQYEDVPRHSSFNRQRHRNFPSRHTTFIIPRRRNRY